MESGEIVSPLAQRMLDVEQGKKGKGGKKLGKRTVMLDVEDAKKVKKSEDRKSGERNVLLGHGGMQIELKNTSKEKKKKRSRSRSDGSKSHRSKSRESRKHEKDGEQVCVVSDTNNPSPGTKARKVLVQLEQKVAALKQAKKKADKRNKADFISPIRPPTNSKTNGKASVFERLGSGGSDTFGTSLRPIDAQTGSLRISAPPSSGSDRSRSPSLARSRDSSVSRGAAKSPTKKSRESATRESIARRSPPEKHNWPRSRESSILRGPKSRESATRELIARRSPPKIKRQPPSPQPMSQGSYSPIAMDIVSSDSPPWSPPPKHRKVPGVDLA